MVFVRTTDRDPSLPHQIVISTGRWEGEISVSCNCRKFSYNGGYSPMEHVPVGEDALLRAKEIYNQTWRHNKVDGEPDFHPDFNNYITTRHVEVAE
jgi:hypothetical protein